MFAGTLLGGDPMQLIEFPGSMDMLLGKVTVAYVADLYLDTDRLRILDLDGLIVRRKLPALIYGVSPLSKMWWPQVAKLLEKGEIGLIVPAYGVEDLKREGIDVDYIALYGSESFWDAVAEVPERYGLSKDRFRVLVEMFGRHLTTLRLFYDSGSLLLPYIRDYRAGIVSREQLVTHFVDLILDITAYREYVASAEIPMKLLAVMRMSNELVIDELEDPTILLELDKPAALKATIEFNDESDTENMYRKLKLLHPRAVDRQDSRTIVVRYFF